MSGEPAICPACGGENLAGAKFCGACGHDVSGVGAPVAAPAPQPAPAPAANPKRTMLGMSPIVPPVGHDASPAPLEDNEEPTLHSGPPDEVLKAAAKTAPAKNRTMMGMSPIVGPSGEPLPTGPLVDAEAPTAPSAAVPTNDALPAATNRTMLGMPQVEMQAAVKAAQAKAAAGGGKAADPLGPSNRTMLGMQAREMPDQTQPKHDSNFPPGPATPASQPPRKRAQVHWANASDVPSTPPKAKGSRAVVFIGVGAMLFLAMIGGALGLYLIFGGDSGASVRASVVPTEAGDGLHVEVVDAPEGTRARFSGQELPLEDGVAVFPLAADTLRVGDNQLTVELVAEGGDVEPHDVTLTVSYRIRADLTSMTEDPPTLAIVVDAVVGSTITIGGEPVTLDAEGRGERRFDIDGGGEAILEHRAEYHVGLPDGQEHAGAVETRVPYATLQIDRPGADVVTDSDAVEIAGAIHPSGTITVDGAEVATTDGRFVHDYALDAVGEREVRVLARQPGRAPHGVTLSIRRVADLAAEAASFTPEPGLTYARLSQNPTIYRSQRIALEGRIYNINVQSGQSVLQMLVRDCPRGERCPLWVTYPQATDATINDWVRVLGTVAGEQQFRSESDRVITVPRVDAQYVLPAQAR